MYTTNQKTEIAVIGGGAAGLIAAMFAAEGSARVTVFEKNEKLGRKLRITGKGRCNVTNNCEINEFLQNVPTNPRFLYSALHRFEPSDTMAMFERLGVPLKTERGRRVFPLSDNANDIADALRRECLRLGVIFKREKVNDILTKGNKTVGVVSSVKQYKFNAVIIATGGISYPRTGSDGDGHRFAQKLGHSVTALTPSLVPIVAGGICAECQGLSLRNIGFSIENTNGKCVYQDFGELMFTHFGLTGPVVLSSSAHIPDLTPGKYTAVIDLKPALDEKQLDTRLLSDFSKYINKDFCNSLSDLLPQKLIAPIIRLSGIDGRTKVNEITKLQRQNLVKLIKGLRIPLKTHRPIDEAIITKGGISVKEINPKTMESKLIEGLFFAGEVIDVDAYTGGYNLQIAFSTGVLAGESAAQKNYTENETMVKIAIDGPSGGGKSTLAKRLSKELGIVYVDTGALYRTIGYYAHIKGIEKDDRASVVALLPEIQIEIKYFDGAQHVFLNGEDLGDKIRQPIISMYASAVSAMPEVREFLLETQRKIARENSVIMDGRDIGTVILPDADVKIFLFASNEDRAARRCAELKEKGVDAKYEDVLAEMNERDKNDSSREIAPAIPAEDAVMLNNSGFTPDDTYNAALDIIKNKLGGSLQL